MLRLILLFTQKGSLSTTLVFSHRIWGYVDLHVQQCHCWCQPGILHTCIQAGLQGPTCLCVYVHFTTFGWDFVHHTFDMLYQGLPFSLVSKLLSVSWLRILSWSQFIDTSIEPVHSLLSCMEGSVFLIVPVADVRHVPSCSSSSWVHTGLGSLGIENLFKVFVRDA